MVTKCRPKSNKNNSDGSKWRRTAKITVHDNRNYDHDDDADKKASKTTITHLQRERDVVEAVVLRVAAHDVRQ